VQDSRTISDEEEEAVELESATKELLARIDSMDVDGLIGSATDDAQGVDEISRRWLRGKNEVGAYLQQLKGSVSGVRTELRDAEERVWGDTAVVTCWFDQDYTLDGKPEHVSAPTTIVFRREGGSWKLALFHSIPLPG
jgi:ketosteroid isomerase-like protein